MKQSREHNLTGSPSPRTRIAKAASAMAFASLLVGACVVGNSGARPEPDAAPDASPEELARQAFVDSALPILQAAACSSCHSLEPNGPFLAGSDPDEIRDALLNFTPNVVNLEAPASSRLLTKGAHSGPALNSSDSAALLDWLNLEKDLAPEPEEGATNEVAPFSPEFCESGEPGDATCPINRIPLDDVGAAGAVLSFTAEPLASGLYLSELSIEGGPSGAYLEHPLFISWESQTEKVFDEFDRFFSAKVNTAPDEVAPIGGGTAVFVQFDPSKPISVAFQVLEAYRPEDNNGPVGGCKVLDSFDTNAKGPLQNNCVSCHGGGQANAQSAMNLAGIINDADLQTACNEVLLKSNLDTPETSSIFVATDPGQGAAHPFKFGGNAGNHANFVSSVSIWINQEKTAP